jgi:CRISPR-associated protein Cas2
MYKTDFILTYDISDEKRLRRISRYMEKNALRIQRSVYLCKQLSKENLYEMLQYIAEILDSQKDDLRVYKIKKGSISLNSAIDIDKATIF